MKLPGEALLELEIEGGDRGEGGGLTKLTQTARFQPRGLAGLLYWWTVVPFHAFVFRGMLDGIRRQAEEIEAGRSGAAARADPAEGADDPRPVE